MNKESRKEALKLPQPDKSKMDVVKSIIEKIAENVGDKDASLKELGDITGKKHDETEFAEYWGWTDLDTLAEITLMPETPYISNLEKDEVMEIVKNIKEAMVSCEDAKTAYYTEMLKKSLGVSEIIGYIMTDSALENIAEELIKASKTSVIVL